MCDTTFYTEGETIEKQELQFIGKILENSAIDFGKDGIETVDLLSGEGDVTYEEMEFVMKKNPKTQVLSINLKQEITSSKNYYLGAGMVQFYTLTIIIPQVLGEQRASPI